MRNICQSCVVLHTSIIQIVVLIVILIAPMRRPRRTAILLVWLWYSYKSLVISARMLQLMSNIKIGRGRSCYRDIVSRIFRDNFRLRSNFQVLPSSPTILVTTYPVTLLEYLVPILIPGRTCLLATLEAKNWMDTVYTERECCYIGTEKGGRYDAVKAMIAERLKDSHVIMYVEDSNRRYGRSVGKLREGAFRMAKELGATVTPLIIDEVLETRWCIPEQNFEIYIGPTTHVSDPLSTLIEVRTLMREKKAYFNGNKLIA